MKLSQIALLFTFCVAALSLINAQKICGTAPLYPDHVQDSKKLGIYNGYIPEPHSVPWMASIIYSTTYGAFCGGTIIDNAWVLTAAHCLRNKKAEDMIIVAGETKLFYKQFSIVGIQMSRVEEVHRHPYYVGGENLDDIALLKLRSPFKYTDYVQPGCLPEVNNTLIPRVYTATGFGKTETGRYPEDLLSVEVPHVRTAFCARLLDPSYVYESNICAGFMQGGKDTCNGDSGGPLTHRSADSDGTLRTILYGVTSWGRGCGRKFRPGVYTRVQSYLDWIDFTTELPLSYPDGRYSNATTWFAPHFTPLTTKY